MSSTPQDNTNLDFSEIQDLDGADAKEVWHDEIFDKTVSLEEFIGGLKEEI